MTAATVNHALAVACAACALCIASASCESDGRDGYTGDADLVAVAEREGPRLADVFGINEDYANLEWGLLDEWSHESNGDITINPKHKDQPKSQHIVVAHELLHWMAKTTFPAHPAIINDVIVSKYVQGWTD